MIMQTVGVYDDVIITKLKKHNSVNCENMKESPLSGEIIVTTDKEVLSNGKDNLAYMAAKLLFDEFAIKDGVQIKINKRIPIAGGMAGGSADCAAVLKGINKMFELGLTQKDLMERGVKLGADVPYCIMGGCAIARGIGEKLTPLPKPPYCNVIIAKPPVSVSTAYVYGQIKPDLIEKRPDIEKMAEAINNKDLAVLSGLLYNVMEDVTVPKYPVIQEIKDLMLEGGALNSIMSGSGPTVFGLFNDLQTAKNVLKVLEQKNLTEQLYLTEFVDR